MMLYYFSATHIPVPVLHKKALRAAMDVAVWFVTLAPHLNIWYRMSSTEDTMPLINAALKVVMGLFPL